MIIVSSKILSVVTASEANLGLVTLPSAKSTVSIVPSIILILVTELSASIVLVTEPAPGTTEVSTLGSKSAT